MDRTTGRTRLLRVLGVGALTALLVGMTGCRNVSKADYDAALNEANELRTRNAQLEQQSQAKDLQIADLQGRANSQGQYQPAQPSYANPAGSPSYSGSTSGGTPDEDFRNDNGRMVAEIAGDVLFSSGQATVRGEAQAQLNRIAKKLNSTYANKSIRIEGHTDSDPIKRSKWGTNQALSEGRADAVKKYLVSKGVSAGRIMTTGLGATQPKSTKAASRRVEIIVLAN